MMRCKMGKEKGLPSYMQALMFILLPLQQTRQVSSPKCQSP